MAGGHWGSLTASAPQQVAPGDKSASRGLRHMLSRPGRLGTKRWTFQKPSLFTCSAPATHKHMCPVLITMHCLEMNESLMERKIISSGILEPLKRIFYM